MANNKVDFVYKCSDFYTPGDEYGIRWDDSEIAIQWPTAVKPLISDKDSDLPVFSDATYFE